MKDASWNDVLGLIILFGCIGGLLWLNIKWRKWINKK